MATCEMCGEQGTLRKTKVEGAKLKLCDDCQELGEVIEQPGQPQNPRSQQKQTSRKPRNTSPSRKEPDTELVEDYNMRVKQSRESRDLSVGDLAGKIKEKDSVVRRVESGKLAPDHRLARKLEGALGITLYERVKEVATPEESDDPSGTTIGDVAEVRERD